MHRLPTASFERPVPVPDEFEEGGLPNDESPISPMKLGTAWLCATLAGVGALAYASIAELSSTPVMLGLVVLLVAYAGFGYSVHTKDTTHFADSVYYMGFIWALFALIATFILWPAPKLTADAVLTAFGYGLATTFSGMLLRLVIIQFEGTGPNRRTDTKDAIDRRVGALIRELNDATREVSSFRHRAASDLRGTLSDLVQSLAEVRQEIAEQHLTMTKVMNEGFESSLRDILGRLSAIQIPQDMLTAEVTKLMAMLEKQSEDFGEAAHRLQTSLMHAADTVTSFGESLHGSEAARLVEVAINDLSERIRARTEQFIDMTTVLEKSRSDLDGQLNHLQSLRSAVSTVSAQLSAFEAELRDVSAASMSADVRNSLMNVQKAINSSLEASKAIESTMRGVLFFMKERVTEEQSSGRH